MARVRFFTSLSIVALLGIAVGFAACGGSSDGGGGGNETDAGTGQDSGGGTDADTSDADHGLGDSSTSEGGRDRDGSADAGPEGQYMGACTTATPDTQGDCVAGYVCHLYRGRQATYCTERCPDAGNCPTPSPKCGGDGYCAVP